MDFEFENRFQCKPWYVKLWRLRWYLCVPYFFLRYALFTNHLKLKKCFRLAIVDAQVEMDWWYTLEEVDAMMKEDTNNDI